MTQFDPLSEFLALPYEQRKFIVPEPDKTVSQAQGRLLEIAELSGAAGAATSGGLVWAGGARASRAAPVLLARAKEVAPPVWMAGGAVIGIAAGLAWMWRRIRTPDDAFPATAIAMSLAERLDFWRGPRWCCQLGRGG